MLALHLAAHVIGDCTRDISGSRRGLASGSRRSDEQHGKYRDQSCGESRLTKAAGGFGHRWAGIAVAEKEWRRGSESNRRIKVLQTSPLPLGYRAPAQYVSVPCKKSPSRVEDWSGRKLWSGRRGSNPRHRPWQGRALPLSYSRSGGYFTRFEFRLDTPGLFRALPLCEAAPAALIV